MKNDPFNLPNFGDINFNLDFGNFDPEEIQVDETINAVFVVDTSYSVQSYVKELNHAFNDFTESMQKSHVADKLLVSIIEFNDQVSVRGGFQPIANIAPQDFAKRIGGSTALFDAVHKALENALDYRKNLENSGVEAKTLLFVITDGEDNQSKTPPSVIAHKIRDLKKDERGAFSFTSILFGVGTNANFEKARTDMGIEHLAQIGTSGEQMRKMIGFITQSISSMAMNGGQAAPIF